MEKIFISVQLYQATISQSLSIDLFRFTIISALKESNSALVQFRNKLNIPSSGSISPNSLKNFTLQKTFIKTNAPKFVLVLLTVTKVIKCQMTHRFRMLPQLSNTSFQTAVYFVPIFIHSFGIIHHFFKEEIHHYPSLI